VDDVVGILGTPEPQSLRRDGQPTLVQQRLLQMFRWYKANEVSQAEALEHQMAEDMERAEGLKQAREAARRGGRSAEAEDLPARREIRRPVRQVAKPEQMPEWQHELIKYLHDGGDPCVKVEGRRMPIVGIMGRLYVIYTQKAALKIQYIAIETQKAKLDSQWFFNWPSQYAMYAKPLPRELTNSRLRPVGSTHVIFVHNNLV